MTTSTQFVGDECLLEEWARQRGVKVRVLLAASRRGTFPPVVRISQRAHLVRVADLEAWRARSVVSTAPGAIAGALSDQPAEPFAAETTPATAATAPRQRGRRANASTKVARRQRTRKANAS